MIHASGTLPRGRRAALSALFVTSAALACLGLTACDNGTSAASSTPGTSGPATSVDAGKAVFTRYCQVCHPGPNAGAGPALRGLVPNRTDDQLRSVVRTGKNRMPGYGQKQISDEELTGLVAYMHTLK